MKMSKLRSSTICFLAVIVSILNNAGYTEATEDNVEDYVTSDALTVSNFIEENFVEFVKEANVDLEEPWKASYIEEKFPIEVNYLGDVTQGMFLDFDGENGYAVVAENYIFRDFQTEGESPYKGITSTRFQYDALSGYYYEVNGELQNVIDEYDEACRNNLYDEAGAISVYNGQEYFEFTQFGGIVDCLSYLKDKYGKTYTPVKSKSLSMTCYTQDQLSAYTVWSKDSNGFIKEEEHNCAIVSAFNCIQYMRGFNMIKLPSATTKEKFNPSYFEPRSYSSNYDSKGNPISTKITFKNTTHHKYELRTIQSFPTLYCQLREEADNILGRFDTLTLDTELRVIKKVCQKYGYTVDFDCRSLYYAYLNDALTKLEQGYSLIWSFKGHITAVKGYKIYENYKTIGNYKSTTTYAFLELADGYSTRGRFFNMTGYRDNAGIGTLVTMSVK